MKWVIDRPTSVYTANSFGKPSLYNQNKMKNENDLENLGIRILFGNL